MAKNLERYDKLVIVILIIALLILAIGYWFAYEKSEPVYLSKIDKLMFDKNNKSPAYILTLPDKVEVVKQDDNSLGDVFEAKAVVEHEPEVVKDFSLEELISNVPSIAKLENKSFAVTMKNIAMVPELIEITETGEVLPKISADGHKPWIEYGNAVEVLPNFKKIGVVVSNLGYDTATVSKIAAAFNSELSMSFHPYITQAKDDIAIARQKGHETYMDVLLASRDFSREDTGPLALNFDLDKNDILRRFYRVIAKPEPIGGIIIHDGAVADDDRAMLEQLLTEVRNRGLLMVDATSNDVINSVKVEGLARRRADIVITRDMSAAEVDEQIKKAENIAFDKGQVLVVTDEKPLIVVKLAQWIDSFSPQLSYEETKTVEITKPFALVPVSNLVVE